MNKLKGCNRELQRACEENAAMRYLVGGHQVKFRAIAEFRTKFNQEIDNDFCQSVNPRENAPKKDPKPVDQTNDPVCQVPEIPENQGRPE